MATKSELVVDILKYIGAMQPKEDNPSKIPGADVLLAQAAAFGMPGLSIDNPDDVWVRLARPVVSNPPAIGADLWRWVVVYDSAVAEPVLQKTIQVEGTVVEGEAGTIAEAAPLPTPKFGPGRKRAVVKTPGKPLVTMVDIHLEDHPEIQEAFDAYLLNAWKPWAEKEKPVREAYEHYKAIFKAYKDLKVDGGAETLEVVCGMGHAVWKQQGKTEVNYPLLLQPCEITLNDQTNALEIRPATVGPALYISHYADMGIDSVHLIEKHWQEIQPGMDDPNPFKRETFDGVIKQIVGRLDASGEYVDVGLEGRLPIAQNRLKVANSWIFFVRKRPANRLIADLLRLEKVVLATPENELPLMVQNIVDRDTAVIVPCHDIKMRGLEPTGRGDGEVQELYFPLPYNDEQVNIIKKLERNSGVIVQGPPGTGKSHTIGNIICHYLAQGKKVLVTAAGATALSVVREKIPERVRPLTAALLSSDAASVKDFESSISTIAAKVSEADHEKSLRLVATAEHQIDRLHQEIAVIDQNIQAFAAHHTQTYHLDGREFTSCELARMVAEGGEKNAWFTDTLTIQELPTQQEGAPQCPRMTFDDADITRLVLARRRLGDTLLRMGEHVPAEEDLPERGLIENAHAASEAGRQAVVAISDGAVRAFRAGIDRARADVLVAEIKAILSDRERCVKHGEKFSEHHEALRHFLMSTEKSDPVFKKVLAFCENTKQHHDKRCKPAQSRLVIANEAYTSPDFKEALGNLTQGKNAFSLLSFGNKDAKEMVKGVLLDGKQPKSDQQWQDVQQCFKSMALVFKARREWNHLSEVIGLGAVPETPNPMTSMTALYEWALFVDGRHQLMTAVEPGLKAAMADLYGDGSEIDGLDEKSADDILSALNGSLDVMDCIDNNQKLRQKLDAFVNRIPRHDGVCEQIRTFLTDSVGGEDDTVFVLAQWGALMADTEHLRRAQEQLEIVKVASDQIAASGAGLWAKRCRMAPWTGESSDDQIIPKTWREAWVRGTAQAVLRKIDGHQAIKKLFSKRAELSRELSKTYQDIIAERAWMEVAVHSPPKVRQALQKYLNAVKKMGAGTGVRSVRHRATAREAMNEAYRAVPCWIMPQGRVSESMPAELGLFDLVILDEASQAGIDALPAILRGKKLLIVGDDKQVSPSIVGLREEDVKDYINRFLSRQPNKSDLGPDSSIYDLFATIFAGNDVMLKEHFRCVEPIIEFSNREFYDGKIIPLRVPSAKERLNPPLIDILVDGGSCRFEVNAAEALAIAQEIKAILKDPKMDGKTIGVVTLTSKNKQAFEIKKILETYISQEDYIQRQITVGTPAEFQGKERDIMFVSMVWDKTQVGPPNRADIAQRFNVALSRARDRMYLVRSIPNGFSKPDSMLSKVIGHFNEPFAAGGPKSSPKQKCETFFEHDLYDRLVSMGYRVDVKVGSRGYQIDFVVEGLEGKRLAVECDGDRQQSTEDWNADMKRQRVLERAGWTFWRCFAADFYSNQEKLFQDLIDTLHGMGIDPVSSKMDEQIWVTSKTVTLAQLNPDGGSLLIDVQSDVDAAEEGEIEYSDDMSLEDVLDLCDTNSGEFERSIAEFLYKLGYRIKPQFPCFGYKIDMVIEGDDGKRMAIECDGDNYHLNYEKDMERQRFLENAAGLSFWRCWASDFFSDRNAKFQDLLNKLNSNEIFPKGKSPAKMNLNLSSEPE